jgi:hypothetical protein
MPAARHGRRTHGARDAGRYDPPDNNSVGWQTDLHRHLKDLAPKTVGGEPRIAAGQIHLTGGGFNERHRAIAERLLQNRPNGIGIRRTGGIHSERLALLLTLNHRLQHRGGCMVKNPGRHDLNRLQPFSHSAFHYLGWTRPGPGLTPPGLSSNIAQFLITHRVPESL